MKFTSLKTAKNLSDFSMRYTLFAPRVFNFCLSLGMEPNRIMPSVSFCADENQGYPIIQIAEHFGSFPFNHGRIGGIMATDRYGPHSDHGKDIVIIQASHVGYDPATAEFGMYRRIHTSEQVKSADCGGLCSILTWYQEQYDLACQQIALDTIEGKPVLVIDKSLLNPVREEGLFLNLKLMLADQNSITSDKHSESFAASEQFIQHVGNWPARKTEIAEKLSADLFTYKRNLNDIAKGLTILNGNLFEAMPQIICSKAPALAGALVNAEMEFDRTYHTIAREKAYSGKKVVFITGIHIDISPDEGQLMPRTKFVPWAAYIQNEKGEGYTLGQKELYEEISKQSEDNPYKIDLAAAFHKAENEPDVTIQVDE